MNLPRRFLTTLLLIGTPLLATAQRPTATRATVNPETDAWPRLLELNVTGDPDLRYVAGSKGLAPTVFNAALKANDNARVGGPRLMPLIVTAERSGRAAQGSDTLRAAAFANWQYVDRLVVWGGTSSRNVTAPGQAWIDAAHRNGVKIYGNLFLAPRLYGGRVSHVEYLTQADENGVYPVADKLIEMAEAQGFDGWFLNEEVSLTAPRSQRHPGEPAADPVALAEALGGLMDYVQANSDVEIIWYDSMLENGRVYWQEELNTSNDRFFQKDGEVVAEAWFLDFTATVAELQNTKRAANRLGRSEFDLYAGAILESRGIAEGAYALERFATEGATSIGLFRCDKEAWDAFESSGFTDLHAYLRCEEQLYAGEAGDPSDTSRGVVSWDERTDSFSEQTTWKGFAHYLAAKSPLVRDRFVSNFNYGLGRGYYVAGEKLGETDWNNLGAQDILPTWRWRVQTDDPTPVEVNFDFTDAYHGGSSLRVEGSLDAETDVPLYLASMAVFDDSKLTLTYKTGDVGVSGLQVYVEIEGREGTRAPLDVGPTSTAGWNEVELDLSAHAGEKIAAVGLRLLDAEDAEFGVSIGQIGLLRGERDRVASVTGLAVDSLTVSGDTAAARLRWRHSSDYSRDFAANNVDRYRVFQVLGDGSRRFLGVTGGEGLYVDRLLREGGATQASVLVEAVSLEFGLSAPASIAIDWPGESGGDSPTVTRAGGAGSPAEAGS